MEVGAEGVPCGVLQREEGGHDDQNDHRKYLAVFHILVLELVLEHILALERILALALHIQALVQDEMDQVWTNLVLHMLVLDVHDVSHDVQ